MGKREVGWEEQAAKEASGWMGDCGVARRWERTQGGMQCNGGHSRQGCRGGAAVEGMQASLPRSMVMARKVHSKCIERTGSIRPIVEFNKA